MNRSPKCRCESCMAFFYWMNIGKMSIGEQIKEARERHGRKQIEIETLAKMSEGHLSAIETGARMPRLGTLQRLASILGEPFVIGPTSHVATDLEQEEA